MTMSKLVYLSGPMGSLTYDAASSWREYAALAMPPLVRAITPMRGKEVFRQDQSAISEQPDVVNCDSRSITIRDRWDVQRSDAMLVHVPDDQWRRFSTGTTIEIGWADAWRVPIILACERTDEFKAWWDHPILKGCIGWHVETLDEALDILNILFRQENTQ